MKRTESAAMPETPIRVIDPQFIPMADGARLAAKIWLPEDADAKPVPAILEYIPYRRRDATSVRDSHTHPWMAARGYACVRVDLRGSGDSDGVLTGEYLQQELDDGCEVIAWLARQPWCTGAVGVLGNSWGGFNGLQLAAMQPPALKAIITSCSTDDRYADDIHFMGGCLLNDNLRWASTMFAHNSRPPDPAIVGDRWRAMWLERLEGSGLWVETWLRHQRRDAFWKHGSVCEQYQNIRCAVMAIGGWFDAYTNAIPRLMRNLSAPRKALIGQWAHRYPHMAAPGPAIGFLTEAERWWRHWLKGDDTGVMDEPMMRIWIQDDVPPKAFYQSVPGRWVAEASWPPPTVASRSLFLNPGELSDAATAPRSLTLTSPQTLGHSAGKWCPYGFYPDLSGDQREDDGGSLTFDTPPLDAPLDILGAPVVELSVTVDKPQAMLAVRLSNIAPDGAATRVSFGLLNLAHRDSHEHPEPLEPGRRYRLRIQLNDTGQRFPAGNRIRIAISTSYWPIAWPAPEPVLLTLFTSESKLTLPVRQASPEDERLAPFGPPEPITPLATTTNPPGEITHFVTKSKATGATQTDLSNDSGVIQYHDVDLDMRTHTKERFSIAADDPLSARAESDCTVEIGRGDWRVRTHTNTVMTATRDSFELEAVLEAFEGESSVFSRRWKASIPRDCV